MKKKVAILIVIYIALSVGVLSPYLSSFVITKYLNTHLVNPLPFDFKSWGVFFNFLTTNYSSNKTLLTAYYLGLGGFIAPFILLLLIMIISLVIYIKDKNKKSIYGDSSLANDFDLKDSGFFPEKEVEG